MSGPLQLRSVKFRSVEPRTPLPRAGTLQLAKHCHRKPVQEHAGVLFCRQGLG